MIDPKPRPNRQLYVEILRRMTPAQRMLKAMELSDSAKEVFHAGLRRRYPELSDGEFHKLFLERLAKCHNRNW